MRALSRIAGTPVRRANARRRRRHRRAAPSTARSLRQPGDDPRRAPPRRPQLLPVERGRRGRGRGASRRSSTQHYLDAAPAGARHQLREPVRAGGTSTCATPSHGERRVWLDMARKNALLAIAQRVRDRATQETGWRRCATRSACPRARSASSASTSATPWARRRWPRAWSSTGSRCRSPSTAATTSRHHAGRRLRRDAPGARAALPQRRGEESGKLPDLVLIDGGKGQVGVARAVLDETGPAPGVRRRRRQGRGAQAGLEELILAEERSLELAPATIPALHLIQQIRDEAHRFAITGHRARRGKARTTSTLEEIPASAPSAARRCSRASAACAGVRPRASTNRAGRGHQPHARGAHLPATLHCQRRDPFNVPNLAHAGCGSC